MKLSELNGEIFLTSYTQKLVSSLHLNIDYPGKCKDVQRSLGLLEN